jgi:hypothetical protein
MLSKLLISDLAEPLDPASPDQAHALAGGLVSIAR